MSRAMLLRTLACLLGLCPAFLVAQAQQAPVQVQPRRLPENFTVEMLDQGIKNVRQMPWSLLRALEKTPADHEGRTPEKDIADYVLTEETLAKMTAMRDGLAASAAGGAQISTKDVEQLDLLIRSEQCHMSVIWGYWNTRQARAHHRELIDTVIGRLAEADRPAAMQALRAVEAQATPLRPQVPLALQFCDSLPASATPGSVTPPPLLRPDPGLDEYNKLRLQLATQLKFDGSDSLRRSKPCTSPATNTSGRRGVAVRFQPDLREYFPPEAVNFSVSGPARVRLEYDDTGCVVGAALVASTGSDMLDAAALQITFDYLLTPGEEDGKALGGFAVLPVSFNIRDMPLSAPFEDEAVPAGEDQPQP